MPSPPGVRPRSSTVADRTTGRPRAPRALLLAMLLGLLAVQHWLAVHGLEHLFHDHHEEVCELCLHAQGAAGALSAPALPSFARLPEGLDANRPSDPPARPIARRAHPVRAPPVTA